MAPTRKCMYMTNRVPSQCEPVVYLFMHAKLADTPTPSTGIATLNDDISFALTCIIEQIVTVCFMLYFARMPNTQTTIY